MIDFLERNSLKAIAWTLLILASAIVMAILAGCVSKGGIIPNPFGRPKNPPPAVSPIVVWYYSKMMISGWGMIILSIVLGAISQVSTIPLTIPNRVSTSLLTSGLVMAILPVFLEKYETVILWGAVGLVAIALVSLTKKYIFGGKW